MHFLALAALAAIFSMCAVVRGGDPIGDPKPADNGWNPHLFDYVAPARLVVEETTPTPAQMNFWLRPPQVEGADAPDPKETGAADPVAMGNVNIVHLRF